MNKIFKVVWSKSKECYVVVSEVAKNNGGKKKVLASVLAGLAMVGAVGVGQVSAYSAGGGSDTGSNSVAIGPSAVASGANGVAVGRANQATGTSSVALGVNNKAQAQDTTAVGSTNTIEAAATQASAFGRENTINLAGSLAAGYKNTTNGERNVAVGSENTTTGEDSIGIGTKVIAGTGKTIAIGSVASGDGKYLQTIARGNDTVNPATGQVNNIFALAIGNGAQADGKAKSASGMIAIGQEVKADNNNTIAIGVKTEATGNNGTAVGGYAKAIGTSSAAFGTQAVANGLGATAFGPGASAGDGGTAADGSTAVGRKATVTAEGGTGLGWATTVSAKDGTAIGHSATASIAGGVAIGSDSVTTAAAGVQGYNPASDRTNKYSAQAGAIGTSTLAAVSVGNGTTATRQITGLAAGTADTDAVNVAQLKNVNLKYAGDTGNSDVLLKDGTLNVKGDTKLISTSADATGITVTAKVGDNITANAAGKAVAPTTNGIATTDNVTQAINNSGWNVTSLNNGGTTNGTTSEKVSPGDTVTFSAGKNIVLDQAGKQFTYSLSSTLKDIQSIQNGASKITLNNAGGTTISGGNLSVDGNKITKVAQGTDGTDAVNVDQLNAVAAKERHVKPGNYSVDGSGTVTLNYVDGNNADVADTAVISGIAKDDLSNITNAGKKVITGLGSKVEAGDNVTVTDTTDATTGQKTYTVSANLTKVTDGTNTTVTGAGTTANPYKVNVAGDLTGITSIANTAGGPTMTIGGNSINVTGGNLDLGSNKITNLAPGTNDTDAVNYKQLKTAKTVVEAGTNVSVNKTLGANGEDVYTVSATAGGTASTESVVKKAAATGDTNIADVSVAGGKNVNDPGAQYEVSVSKNAVKDAAREAVTVNNGGNTDNPITVTPTDDAANHNTTYAVTFDGDKAAKQIPLTYKANGSGDKTVKLDKGLDFTNGTNTTAEIGNDGVVKFNLKDTVALTNAGSLTVGDTKVNNDGLTISGGPSVTKNGIDAGNQKITNVAPGTISSTSTDAVNGSQLYDVDQKFNNTVKLTGNAGATDGQALNKANGLSFGVIGANNGKYISTSANGSDVTVDLSTDAKKLLNNTVEVKGKNAATVTTSTETTADGGTKTIYTVDVASTGTVAKSSWNIKSSADTANGGAEATGHEAAAKNIADTNTVEMVAGKNLTVKQTSDTDGAKVEYALNKDLKDLTSVTTEKVTTKEIGLQDPTGKVTTIKNDGDRITYTKDGDTKVHKVATLDDEKHIKPGSYAVQNDGSVTMTYVDGNGDPVANDEAKITGIAKQDLSNITDAGKNVITGLGTIVKAGDNVTVSEASNATTGQKTYTVNAVTPAVYTKADGTKVVKRPDGTFTTNVDGAPGNDVPASDVIVSIQDASGNRTGGNSIVNNVGSAIDKTGTSTGNTFLNKLDTAANDTPNAAVNVKDLKNTSDAIIGKGLKFDANDGGEKTNKLGSKVTVKGEGTKANTEYSGTNIKTIIAQTGDDTTIDVKLAKDLTGINSISNTAAGPKMEFGGNSINITGGNLDLGSNKITNLGPATAGSDAVNYDQLKNSRTEVKSSDGSVTVTPTTAGDKTTYDLKVATTGTVAKSTWNIASDKVSATEGTVAAGSGAAQNIADTKTVTMQAGKNLTVNQTNDGNGNASVAFALDKDLKDLTSVTTEKVTTKEIGLQDPTGKVTTIKNDGDRITYTKDGDTKVHKVATLDDEKHIKPGSYAVQNDGSVTMTYVDGNGDPVANDEAKITGIAKQDLSNITDAGKNVITGLGTIVKAGDNVTVSEASNATTGQKTYTVNAVTPAVYTKADGTKVVKRPDGTFTTNVDGAPGNDVPASDVIVSIQDAAGNTIGGNSIVNNVGSAIDKTGTSTGNTFLTNLNNAATDNPFAAVNVRDLKSTADALKASELHIAPTSVATGSTEVVGGTASGNTNPGAATQAYKYNATTKQVELTFNDGNGKAVNGPKAVIDFSDLNTGGTAASSWNIKSSANTTDGGAIGDNHDAAAQNIADNKTVEFQAGKNLVVKQTNDAANGNATVEFSLSDNITAGKDGANGKDGSVGATGKDGSSVVLNGKDGSIGMTGPKGQDGKDGINGRDGADISITSAKGEQVLVNRDPAHNGDTDKAERIVYVPKDANGNPIQGADGKNIVREVATMDDGLRFTGNNTSTENKQKLGSLVKVEGEGVTEAQANSFQSATGNIAVVADGADKLTVKLNKDLKGLDSVTTKEVKLGDANDNISIKKAGDRITYTTPGSTDTHKVATLDDEMHIKDTTYTVDGNKKVTMTYVDGNGNPVAGKTAVIDLSGLPVGETDTDMRIKEGTYTAQNGKVTLNTVDKGGNPVTGKDVVIDGINTNNYVAGDNVTLTPDTDAAGKPVVKINAALSTEKVVKKAGADNLATVSTASGNVAGDKGETYEVAVTKGDIENNAEISYKANGGTAQKTTLANGFNFTSDDNSVAITTGANGKVNFKVDTTGIQGKAFNLDVNKEGTGKVENAQTAAATPSVEKGTKFVAGNNLSIRHDGINGDANYDHQVTYALNSDLKGITSITNNGGATMNFGPNEVSITGGNLNMGGSKITNVKNGTDKSDVATVGQLTKVTSNDNTVAINKTTDADGAPVYDLSVQGGGHDPRVDQLGEEIGRVGAQGAALAALKPIQYDPLEPTQIMAGYGNYRGNSAIAMGVAHYKNESTLMHAGVSWAGGSRHMMANAGVTWKVGNRDSEAAVADRYRKGPISSAYAMQQEMASVKAQNAGLKTEVSDLKAENEQMKAQIAAMMAKLGM